MKSWKTTFSSIAIIAVYVLSYFFPSHKEFLDGLMPILAAAGLLVAKDYDVTGGKR